MWKTGKWVYVEEKDQDEPEPSSPRGPHQVPHRRSCTSDPPSPPWKLGQVPVETAIYKDGRRMSKRFEKLVKDREEKDPKSAKSQLTPPPPTTAIARKERSKSVISNPSSIGKTPENAPRRSRKSSAAAASASSSAPHVSASRPSFGPDEQPSVSTSKLRAPKNTPPTLPEADLEGCSPPKLLSPKSTAPAPPPTLQSLSSPPLLPVPESEELPRAPSPSAPETIPTPPPPLCIIQCQSDEPAPAPPQIALSPVPTKRFRPWEALKSIQTDGAEVAGDLKLIHEAAILSQSKAACSSSSDLTELSSSLSSISSQSCHDSGESDLDDECLPQSLVLRRRPPTRRRKHAQDEEGAMDTGPGEPPAYSKIKANIFPFRKPEPSELPPAMCGCTDGGCGDKCLNRSMLYLCDPKRCLLGQSCTNIPFNLRKDLIDESTHKLGKGLKVFWTGSKRRWGLKTEIRLKKGMFLIDYRGEIISREMCYQRVVNDYREDKTFYFLDYDGSDVIDAGKKGNCSRFINHSCEPNLRVERYKLSGLEEYQVGLFTLREIEPGEELCYDYNWQNFSDIAPTSNIRTDINNYHKNDDDDDDDDDDNNDNVVDLINKASAPTVQRCFCGSKICKGFLGVRRKATTVSSHHHHQKKKNKRGDNNNNNVMKREITTKRRRLLV